jgi:hypothetical protein
MELNDAIKKTIGVFHDNIREDDEAIIKKLVGLGIEEPLADRLLNFITTAFCMVMYESTVLNFQHFYVFFDEKGNVSEPLFLIDEPVFTEAYKIARKEFNENGADEAYLSIASRDAGYKAVQQAVEAGSELKNLQFAPIGIYNPSYFYATKKWWEIWK